MPGEVAPAAPAAPAAPSSSGGGAPPAGGSPPPASGAPAGQPPVAGNAPPAPQAPKYLEREEKVDGKSVKLRASEEELWAAYRKGTTVDRRFEEVAQHRREVAERAAALEAREKKLKEGSIAATLKEIRGDQFDPVEALTNELQQLLNEAEQNADPNVRARKQAEARAAALELEKQQMVQKQEQEQFQAEVAEKRAKLGQEFTAALQLVKLPKNDQTVALMAQAYRTAKSQGMNLTTEQLARSTQKLAAQFVEHATMTESDDELLDLYPNLAGRIHKALVARYNKRKAGVGAAPAPGQPPAPNPNTPAERRPAEDAKPKLLNSKEEHEAYGIKGLRTI